MVSVEIKSIETAVFHQVGRCVPAWDQFWNPILHIILGEEYHLSLSKIANVAHLPVFQMMSKLSFDALRTIGCHTSAMHDLTTCLFCYPPHDL